MVDPHAGFPGDAHPVALADGIAEMLQDVFVRSRVGKGHVPELDGPHRVVGPPGGQRPRARQNEDPGQADKKAGEGRHRPRGMVRETSFRARLRPS